jgi:hypothetical protein
MKAEISTYFRTKRFAFIMSLLDKLTKGGKKIKILDMGGTEDYWNSMGLNLGNNIEIVLLNLYSIADMNVLSTVYSTLSLLV